MRITGFAAFKNFIVKSTMLPSKNLHKATWISPDHITRNQVDHIFIEKKMAENNNQFKNQKRSGFGFESLHGMIKLKHRIKDKRAIRN